MNSKPVIALVLGLVFQLAQVLPAAVTEPPCVTHGESCCCDSADACECVDRGDSDPEPLPVPASNGESHKLSVARLPETRLTQVPVPGLAVSVPVTAQLPDVTVSGYAGVRLSVAFCSFVM